MGTATLVDAAAMAEVVDTTTEPAGSVDERVTGIITGVEEVDGGGAGAVVSEVTVCPWESVVVMVSVVEVVVVGAETFCLLIRSRAATANNLVANGGSSECTASKADLSCSYIPSWYFGCRFFCNAAWIDCSGRASSSSRNSACPSTDRSDGSGLV